MNAITATGTDVLTSTSPAIRRPRLRLVAAAAIVFAGTTTAVVIADQSGHSSSRPVFTDAKLMQDQTVKDDRLLAQVDAVTGTDPTTMSQIHDVTGVSAAAQQARTRLYQELRATR